MATSLRPANYYTVITLHLWWLTARSAILSKTEKLSIVFLPPIGFCINNQFSNWRRNLCQFFIQPFQSVKSSPHACLIPRVKSRRQRAARRSAWCILNILLKPITKAFFISFCFYLLLLNILFFTTLTILSHTEKRDNS